IRFAQKQLDSKTLTEEALHFIVYHFWSDPEFQSLLNAKAETGESWLTTTKEWNSDYSRYLKVYAEQFPNEAETLATMEIVTKILTNYLIDKFNNPNRSTSSRFLNKTSDKIDVLITSKNGLYRFIGKIFDRLRALIRAVFGRQNPDKTYTVNFPKEVREALGEIGDKFIAQVYNIPIT